MAVPLTFAGKRGAILLQQSATIAEFTECTSGLSACGRLSIESLRQSKTCASSQHETGVNQPQRIDGGRHTSVADRADLSAACYTWHENKRGVVEAQACWRDCGPVAIRGLGCQTSCGKATRLAPQTLRAGCPRMQVYHAVLQRPFEVLKSNTPP